MPGTRVAGRAAGKGWAARAATAVVALLLTALLGGCSSAGSTTEPGASLASIYAQAEGVAGQDLAQRQARDATVFEWSAGLGLGEPFSAAAFTAAYVNSTAAAAPATSAEPGVSAAPASAAPGAYGARTMSLWDFYLDEVELREQRIRSHLAEALTPAEVRVYYDSHQDAFSRQDEITVKVTGWEDGRALAPSELNIDASNVRMLQEADDALISAALNLTPGQQSTVQRPDGRFAHIECLSRTDGGVEEFDAVAQAAASQLAAERFEAELVRRLGGARQTETSAGN